MRERVLLIIWPVAFNNLSAIIRNILEKGSQFLINLGLQSLVISIKTLYNNYSFVSIMALITKK